MPGSSGLKDFLSGLPWPMMLPGAVYMIPLYLAWHRLGAMEPSFQDVPYWLAMLSASSLPQMYRGIL